MKHALARSAAIARRPLAVAAAPLAARAAGAAAVAPSRFVALSPLSSSSSSSSSWSSSSWQSRPLAPRRAAFSTAAKAPNGGGASSGRATNECTVVCVTSGKGGVGKTTTTSSIGMGLAEEGFKTCVIDFDIGLRNLDLHLGMERRVIYDFVHVIDGTATLKQALIQDKRCPNLYLLAASQTKDKNALSEKGVERVINELRQQFDFVLCDSPAGIESGAMHAMLFADRAIICTNPEVSSVRDSDKMIGFISSKSRRAASNNALPVEQTLLVTRYNPKRSADGTTLTLDDITELLGVPLLGVIPEDTDCVLNATNTGKPAVLMRDSKVAQSYQDSVARLLGRETPLRFTENIEESAFKKLMKRLF